MLKVLKQENEIYLIVFEDSKKYIKKNKALFDGLKLLF